MVQRQHHYHFLPLYFIGMLLISVAGCKQHQQKSRQQHTLPADAVRFPDRVQAEFAKGFQISYHENYKLLEILQPFQDQADTLRYSLVPRSIAGQVEVENTEEIPIPIESMIATSTTHIGLTDMLNATDVISGMAGADYVYNEEVNRRIRRDSIVSLQQGEVNKEKVLAMNPDLLMISGGQSAQFDNYRLLTDAGISVMVNSEWLETTPLGKAEWVKVLAALLNRERLANQRFSRVVDKYQALKERVEKKADGKPLVINNMPYKGAWFVPGGESFTAQYLKDAGAGYPWYESDKTGGLRKDFEVVYEVGLRADVWLNPGSAETKEDILAKDSRFADFKPFKTGQIYNNNRRVNASGGNDFWESGVVHPERVLADLIKIFHPRLAEDHKLYYYQKVE